MQTVEKITPLLYLCCKCQKAAQNKNRSKWVCCDRCQSKNAKDWKTTKTFFCETFKKLSIIVFPLNLILTRQSIRSIRFRSQLYKQAFQNEKWYLLVEFWVTSFLFFAISQVTNCGCAFYYFSKRFWKILILVSVERFDFEDEISL